MGGVEQEYKIVLLLRWEALKMEVGGFLFLFAVIKLQRKVSAKTQGYTVKALLRQIKHI
jgi:hypothetical protein